MDLPLTDEQVELLVAELDRIIDGDRYPLSARIRALRTIRALLRPHRNARRGRRRSGNTSRRPRVDIAGEVTVTATSRASIEWQDPIRRIFGTVWLVQWRAAVRVGRRQRCSG